MKTKLIFVALFAFLFTFVAFAENFDKGKRKDKKRHREQNKEIRAYVDKNVLPVLREQRSKLESKITLQDRQKLDELRKQLETLKGQRKSFRKDISEISEKGEMTEEQRNKMKEVHKQMHTIMQSSKEIAKNYEADIVQLLTSLEPQKAQWKQDIKTIIEKYKKNDVPDSTKQKHHRHHKGNGTDSSNHKHHKFGMLKMMKFEHFKEMKPAAFLLMKADDNNAIKSMALPNDMNNVEEKTNIYPNPSANEQTTIDFKVKEAGIITIVLIDGQGNIVRNVMSENKEKGKYSVIVDLTGLKEATYFYRIVMPNKTETNKLEIKN
jgi:hypothetical protein